MNLHPGKDGLTQVLSLKTSAGVVKRALAKMCILPIDVKASISKGGVCTNLNELSREFFCTKLAKAVNVIRNSELISSLHEAMKAKGLNCFSSNK